MSGANILIDVGGRRGRSNVWGGEGGGDANLLARPETTRSLGWTACAVFSPVLLYVVLQILARYDRWTQGSEQSLLFLGSFAPVRWYFVKASLRLIPIYIILHTYYHEAYLPCIFFLEA